MLTSRLGETRLASTLLLAPRARRASPAGWMVLGGLAILSGCGSDDNAAPTGTAGTSGSTTSSGAAGAGTSMAGAAGSAATTGAAASGAAGESGSTSDGGMAGTDGGGTGGAGGGTDSGPDGPSDCGPSGPLARPAVATAIAAPDAATLMARLHAEGTQIYTCTATGGDGGSDAAPAYGWTLKAPNAKLYDANSNCAEVGTHFAGPTWKSSVDGSSVAGTRLASSTSPNTNSIALLLLQAMSHAGEGMFTNVTYIQRLDTKGGNAPADGCSAATVGMETAVSYSANYYFYSGAAGADGAAGDARAGDGAGD